MTEIYKFDPAGMRDALRNRMEVIQIFSLNYRRRVLVMAFPAAAIMAAPFVELLFVSRIGAGWLADLIEALLVSVAALVWIVALRKQKEAILGAARKF